MPLSPLTFLSLPTGLLAAAIALPTLIALYLLKLRRRPLRISSTLLWTQAVQDLEVNVPLRWLKASILLFLHLLIVLLLCLAIARPALTNGSGKVRRTIYVIDRSASMSAVDEGSTSRLDLAKLRARESIDALARANGSGAVIAFAAQPVILSAFSASGPALNAAINDIAPTDQPADLPAALQLADSLIAGSGSEESTEVVDVILISDGNIPDQPRQLTTAGQLRFVSVAPKSLPPADSTSPQVSPPPTPNLAITALSARRDEVDPATIRVFARVQSTFTTPRTVTLALSLNAEPVQRKPVEVPALGTDSTPGEIVTTFELVQPRSGILMLALPSGDALAADDSASLIIREARKPNVLLVQPPAVATTDDPQGDLSPDWLLSDALKEMPLGSLRRVSADQARTLSLDATSPPDLIIFDRVAPESWPSIPTLSFGVPLTLPGIRTEIPKPDASPAAQPILSWERSHPALRDVALDTLIFTRPLRFVIDEQAATRAKIQTTELARSPGGPAILMLEQPTPAGSVRRLAISFELQQSNWPISVGFPIFLANAIDFLTLRTEQSAGAAFTTTQPAWISAAGRTGAVTLTGPLKLTADIPPNSAADAHISLGVVERAGIYLSDAAPSQPQAAIAVNMADPFESSLRTRDRLPIAGQDVASSADAVGTREIWPWLVIAAAVLMAAEWFLHAAKARV